MNFDTENLKQALKTSLIGGFNIIIRNNQIELEVFRTDFLNAPIQIKNENFNLELHKKYCNSGNFYLSYKLYFTA